MQSLKAIYRIGPGPSSSHTMAPRAAALLCAERAPGAASFRVTFYGSLGATGKGHLADAAIESALGRGRTDIVWTPDEELPLHANGMRFDARDSDGNEIASWRFYSVGGGALLEEGAGAPPAVYELTTMADLLAWADRHGRNLWEHVESVESPAIFEHLDAVWDAMSRAVERGLVAEGVLPGGLNLRRKSRSVFLKTRRMSELVRRTGLLSAYALAVAEENASGGTVVTAPTCGAAGVLPSVLRYMVEAERAPREDVLRALALAGLIGNLVKHNASISGAEVGCQGEIGTACAMAAGAAAQLMGGSPEQIEYAAEMALEHHLGLTCDPIGGLVQIPCIERNAFAAIRAMDCAEYAMLSDGRHRISFDEVVATMYRTGVDLPRGYRETSTAGLAAVYRPRQCDSR